MRYVRLAPLARTCALLTLLAAPTLATTVERMSSIQELVARSGIVVRAEVSGIDYRLEGQRPFTFVGLDVHDVLHGRETSRRLTLRMYGGRFGDIQTLVMGSPRLSVEEEVVLFLTPHPDGSSFAVVNLAEGKFAVRRDPSGSARVERDLQGIHYLGSDDVQIPETLEQLEELIRAARR